MGSKRHVLTDGSGIPLAVKLTPANTHDCRVAEVLVESLRPIARPRGRPRRWPASLAADKAYDSFQVRAVLRSHGIRPLIPHRGEDTEPGVGKVRWVVERTLSWLSQFRRLRVRYEKRADIHEALLSIGCALICWNFLQPWF
jgi:transposase